ncbi:hypothetical protein Q6670_004052 [Salmonella enterica]|nr:hypothetical protein [Salmonella enterica]
MQTKIELGQKQEAALAGHVLSPLKSFFEGADIDWSLENKSVNDHKNRINSFFTDLLDEQEINLFFLLTGKGVNKPLYAALACQKSLERIKAVLNNVNLEVPIELGSCFLQVVRRYADEYNRLTSPGICLNFSIMTDQGVPLVNASVSKTHSDSKDYKIVCEGESAVVMLTVTPEIQVSGDLPVPYELLALQCVPLSGGNDYSIEAKVNPGKNSGTVALRPNIKMTPGTMYQWNIQATLTNGIKVESDAHLSIPKP